MKLAELQRKVKLISRELKATVKGNVNVSKPPLQLLRPASVVRLQILDKSNYICFFFPTLIIGLYRLPLCRCRTLRSNSKWRRICRWLECKHNLDSVKHHLHPCCAVPQISGGKRGSASATAHWRAHMFWFTCTFASITNAPAGVNAKTGAHSVL